MSDLTQREKLFARITQLLRDNPSRVLRLAVIVDEKGEPLLWFTDETTKVEGKKTDVIMGAT